MTPSLDGGGGKAKPPNDMLLKLASDHSLLQEDIVLTCALYLGKGGVQERRGVSLQVSTKLGMMWWFVTYDT